MPMTVEQFEEKEKDARGEILGYAECHRCCFGGPADTKDHWHWPVRSKVAWDRLVAAQKTGKTSKVACPICGHGDNTSAFILDSRHLKHQRILEKREHGDKMSILQKQLEEKEREIRELKLAKGGNSAVIEPGPEPAKRGQYKAKETA